MKGLGARLLAQRERLGLSQGDVARRIAVRRVQDGYPGQKATDRVTISHFENDRRVPSAVSLLELAQALECSVDYLLGHVPPLPGGAGKPADEGSGPEGETGA